MMGRKTREGLLIEFNGSQLRQARQWRAELTPAMVEALVDATAEALTNVRKHAGVDTATVRATIADQALTVTILDHGQGFNEATVRHGIGLDRSIPERIAAVGGSASIDSSPGGGTYVEISIPLAAPDPVPPTDATVVIPGRRERPDAAGDVGKASP